MPVSNALLRLLQVRALEEEQHKLALESALGQLHRLDAALRVARTRERAGRAQIAQSAYTGDPAERVAGLVETEAGHHGAQLLMRRLAAAQERAAELRDQYLAKRVERRQVEAVIGEAEAQAFLELGRREQQSVDEWFGMRHHAKKAQPPAARNAAPSDRLPAAEYEMKNRKE